MKSTINARIACLVIGLLAITAGFTAGCRQQENVPPPPVDTPPADQPSAPPPAQ